MSTTDPHKPEENLILGLIIAQLHETRPTSHNKFH
jgi:hypothetical protein